MSLCSLQTLRLLSERPQFVRNFCMVAHVDHGKTTLSDYLVASNGVLSNQLAGQVRLLDSRPDEQERCITMKASSIALAHQYLSQKYLLNLVDSPGHIDFSSEVSTAMRLCDGALIIVDVVDGVTQQTCAMLRHAYREGLSMCLILNKIDLLIRTQCFSAQQAYVRMRMLIETCNATLASYANQMHIREQMKDMSRDDPSDDVWFQPTKGNVVFCSCCDGWAFDVNVFASIYASKLSFVNLPQCLWGEFYLDMKNKVVQSTPKKSGQANLAVQLMLQPIWQLYSAFLGDVDSPCQYTYDTTKNAYNTNNTTTTTTTTTTTNCYDNGGKCTENRTGNDNNSIADIAGKCNVIHTSHQSRQVVSETNNTNTIVNNVNDNKRSNSCNCWSTTQRKQYSTKSSINTRCVQMSNKLGISQKVWNHPRRDWRGKLKTLLSAWIPLARCVLDVICTHLDNPITAQTRRLPALMDWPQQLKNSKTEEELMNCNNERTSPCIAYVCKLIDTQYLVGRTIGTVQNDDDAFVGFARVYCGRLRTNDAVYVHSNGVTTKVHISKLFIFRGAGLEQTNEVCAGCLCGVGGITPYIVKYGTLSSCQHVPLFRPLLLQSTSIVRLSVYPKNPKDLFKLQKGMRLLYKVDAQVQIAILPTGQHVIGTAGQVHAQRCVKDLRDTFAQIDIVTSQPIVSFRQTILMTSRTAKPKSFTVAVCDGAFSITITARSLPQDVMQIIRSDEHNHDNDASIIHSIESALQNNKRFSRQMRYGIISYGPIKLGFVGVLLLADFDDVTTTTTTATTTTTPTTVINDNPTITLIASEANTNVASVNNKSVQQNNHNNFAHEVCENKRSKQDDNNPSDKVNQNSLHTNTTSTEVRLKKHTDTNNMTKRQQRCLSLLSRWRQSIVAGFQAAAQAGPMAQQPLYGIAFTITNISCNQTDNSNIKQDVQGDNVNDNNHLVSLTGGAVLPCVRDACRGAMQSNPRRLVQPIYECTVYSSGLTQGKIYALLSRRRAEIIEQVPNEGSDLFYIRCELPAVEAFGLQDDLRVHTQGASTAQLVMSHWSVIEADPYFVPTTREEIEQHGTEVTTKNLAQLLLERIRRRKGLYRECVVENAEKQKFSLKAA